MAFTLLNAITETRRHLNDSTESVWTDNDISEFINEGLMIIKATIPEYFTDLEEAISKTDIIIIDNLYKKLPCLFAAARCFEQDEQNYRAVQKMNEFESRKMDMETYIRNSKEYEDKINDPNNPYHNEDVEYVKDVYSYSTIKDDIVLPLIP
ncbi:MAG: hypothetical protein PHY47_12910 [Lachnospiraceae bacterium]|nr:hypothetical protein [Lachnospiraceae bacterium]